MAGFDPGESIALRPGLCLPDWSGLTDPGGRAALAASMAVAGRRGKWAGLDPAEDAVRRAVLQHFAARGTAPPVRDVAAQTAQAADAALAVLRRLQARDLLLLDDTEGTVAACYPFSARPTPHRVLLGAAAVPVHALCAIDALGMGGMLGMNTEIHSRCAHCGAPVMVRSCDAGRNLAAAAPAEVLVWSGTRYAGGCAATSGCALKPFFCSGGHLESWRAASDPGGPGHRLSLPVAFQVGLALFGPMLRPGG